MQRWDFINYLIEKYGYERYLEIGLDAGHNFSQVKCEVKESVDPSSNPTHKMTSDEYFERIAPLQNKWDIVFIDGLHHAQQVSRDIKNSLNHLAENGSIVLHDCNPVTELHQRVPRASSHWNGDVWKAVADYRSVGGRCLVVNTDEGLGWIHHSLPSPKPFEVEYTYQALEKNRHLYLGLVDSVEETPDVTE